MSCRECFKCVVQCVALSVAVSGTMNSSELQRIFECVVRDDVSCLVFECFMLSSLGLRI